MTRPTVFLIDDDEDDREIFEIALRQANEGATCMTFGSGREALQTISKDSLQPDHIFLDINMPVMTGKDCLREIRKVQHLKDVPIYMYTTSSNVSDRDAYLSLGARKILHKPFRISDLVAMLKELIR